MTVFYPSTTPAGPVERGPFRFRFAVDGSPAPGNDALDGGHGAYLSPLPPGLDGLVGDLLNDPPGFDRSVLPAIDARIVGHFRRHLLPGAAPSTPP